MPEDMLVETLEKVRRHPWHHARANLTLRLLRSLDIFPPASIMEVGCGWGLNLTMLESSGYNTTGMDISRQILRRIDKPGRQLIEADLNQQFPDGVRRYDAVLALDVIEHLDDDQGAVRRIGRLLKPGGVAIVSVPAMPDLYSDFDSIQGHRRRYLPETLRLAIEGGGLEVTNILWWGAWMVPIMRRTRLKSNESKKVKTYSDYLSIPPWPAPLLLRLAYAFEETRAINGKLSKGSSLFATARLSNRTQRQDS